MYQCSLFLWEKNETRYLFHALAQLSSRRVEKYGFLPSSRRGSASENAFRFERRGNLITIPYLSVRTPFAEPPVFGFPIKEWFSRTVCLERERSALR
jgi:hypothetical protein